MRIDLTPLTPRTHRLAITRDDGTAESAELETRSLLLHDLVHLAVETEAGLTRGFWGLVAEGRTMDSLRIDDPGDVGDLLVAEQLVGPMQAVWNERLSPKMYVAHFAASHRAVDRAFVERVRGRLRELTGHWKATRHGQTMSVHWPLQP
jgi:hypothetical protein